MKKHIVILSTMIILAIGFVIFGYRQRYKVGEQKSEVNTQQEKENSASSMAILPSEPKDAQEDRKDSTPVVETQEEDIDREILKIIDDIVATREREQARIDDEEEDPVTAAWKHLEEISQNPRKWGYLLPEATELIEQLTPTWSMSTEAEGEETMDLLDQLAKLQDPRSPEVFVNYFYAGIWGEAIEEALIAIGPPAVPPLIPLLDHESMLKRARGVKVLGIIASEHRQDLGGAVEYIILPKLEELAISDPHPRVRQYASEAVVRLR